MTKPLATKKRVEPVKVAFTPCDLVAKEGEVPVLEILGFDGLERHQAHEVDRIAADTDERIETFFQDYGVARTGDDLTDFRSLALQMALKLFPHFRFRDNPCLLEFLFPLYGLFFGNGGVYAYKFLIVRMADTQGLLPMEKQSYDRKPGNPLAQLQLLADAKAANLKWPRRRPSDRYTAKLLIENEPFKARWGGLSQKRLQHLLSDAREFCDHPKDLSECPEN